MINYPKMAKNVINEVKINSIKTSKKAFLDGKNANNNKAKNSEELQNLKNFEKKYCDRDTRFYYDYDSEYHKIKKIQELEKYYKEYDDDSDEDKINNKEINDKLNKYKRKNTTYEMVDDLINKIPENLIFFEKFEKNDVFEKLGLDTILENYNKYKSGYIHPNDNAK